MLRRGFTVLVLALLLFGQGLFYAHFLLHHHVLSVHSGRVIHGDHCPDHEGPHGALPEGSDEDLCQYSWVFSLGSQLQLPTLGLLPLPAPATLPQGWSGDSQAAPAALAVLDRAPSHSPPYQA